MKALGYLMLMTLKNKILSLKNKPAMLILYLIFAGSIAFMMITSGRKGKSVQEIGKVQDIRILYLIVAGVALLFLFSFVFNGLSTGSTLFNMADVGLLFTAPISTRKILLYGLLKQMATTFFTAIFILYQVGTIREKFGLGPGTIFSLFFIYAIIIFFSQLLSIGIYIFSNGNPKRKTVVKIIFYGFVVLIGLGIYGLYVRHGGSIFDAALRLMDYKPFYSIPVVGWSIMFVNASVTGKAFYMTVALLLFLLSGLLIISLFTTNDADYYEDVLTSTEIAHKRLSDAKEGKRTTRSRNVKVKKEQTGLWGGKGVSAIFYKHILEKKRSSYFLFVDTYTVLAAAGAGIGVYFNDNDYFLYIVLGVLVYIEFFRSILGPLTDELSKPFLYMIPEKSIKKVIAASLTTILKPCIDGAIIFTVVCLVSKTQPLLNVFLALAYASSGIIFISYTLLCQRVLGGQPNKIVSGMFGILLLLVVMAPGIGFSVMAILMLPESLKFLGTFPFTFCCIVIAILVFVLCGDLLDKAEYTGK